MSSILNIDIVPHTKLSILKELEERLEKKSFTQVVSLNPEILVTASNNKNYREVINNANIKLIDGVGIQLAGKILSINVGERYSGVDLMKDLMKVANRIGVKVLFIGGFGNVPDELAEKLSKEYSKATFMGHEGYKDVSTITEQEEEKIVALLSEYKPDLLFIAFGAPYQDEWISEHKKYLKNTVCMGVGGSFDFLAGRVKRAPHIVQNVGLEWLFRLIIQPWRWRRQLKLLTFVRLVLAQRFRHT